MSDWIGILGIALAIVVPTLASWRAGVQRDAKIEAKVDTVLVELTGVKQAQRDHEAEDDRRQTEFERRLRDESEARHGLALQLVGRGGRQEGGR
jgi:hypothetical protein